MFGKAHNDEQNQHQFNIWKSFSLLKSLPWKELVANTKLHEIVESEDNWVVSNYQLRRQGKLNLVFFSHFLFCLLI